MISFGPNIEGAHSPVEAGEYRERGKILATAGGVLNA